jgi:hypothetical protein
MRYAILIAMLVACAPAEGESEHEGHVLDSGDIAPLAPSKRTIISAAAAEGPSPFSVGGPEFHGSQWTWPAYGTFMFYPVSAPVGCIVHSASHRVNKASDENTRFTVEMVVFRDGVQYLALGSSNGDDAPGLVTIPVNALFVVNDASDYQIRVSRTGGPSGVDHSMWSAVDVSCP